MKIFYTLLYLLTLSGCATVPDMQYRTDVNSVVTTNEKSKVFVVEFKENGEPFSSNQIDQVIKHIESSSKPIDTVIFVHGWHHNAMTTDGNYADFTSFIKRASLNSKNDIIGIYIGWRGDSIASYLDVLLPQALTDFFTLYGRKNTSISVGKKGLTRVINALESLQSNSKIQSILAIGHSLGGSVVFHSLDETKLKRAAMQGHQHFILLNPAISSEEYQSIDTGRFAQSAITPTLITLQSDRDVAVNYAYKFAYFIRGAGFDDELITHDLWACWDKDTECLNMLQEKKTSNHCAKSLNTDTWFLDARDDNGMRAPKCEDAWRRADWVIDARHTVSSSHNSILTDAQADAVLDILGRN